MLLGIAWNEENCKIDDKYLTAVFLWKMDIFPSSKISARSVWFEVCYACNRKMDIWLPERSLRRYKRMKWLMTDFLWNYRLEGFGLGAKIFFLVNARSNEKCEFGLHEVIASASGLSSEKNSQEQRNFFRFSYTWVD